MCYIKSDLYWNFIRGKKTKVKKRKGFYNEKVFMCSASGVGETGSLKKSNYV